MAGARIFCLHLARTADKQRQRQRRRQQKVSFRVLRLLVATCAASLRTACPPYLCCLGCQSDLPPVTYAIFFRRCNPRKKTRAKWPNGGAQGRGGAEEGSREWERDRGREQGLGKGEWAAGSGLGCSLDCCKTLHCCVSAHVACNKHAAHSPRRRDGAWCVACLLWLRQRRTQDALQCRR